MNHPKHSTQQGSALEIDLVPLYQVLLHNDDHNTMDHVINSLMRVFGHSADMATKIMVEAHCKGRAIAEVEAEDQARLHYDQLTSLSLSASIEQI